MGFVEGLADGGLQFALVEEEHLVLLFFFVRVSSHIDRLHSVGVDAGVVHLGGECHGCGREILYLLETIAHAFHFDRQIGHVAQPASGVRTDEIGYQLVAEPRLAAYLVEALLCVDKEVERGLAHLSQDGVGGMLGGDLEASRCVVKHDLAKILPAIVVAALSPTLRFSIP